MSNIKLFESQQIRSTWDEAEQKWYFSIIDVVAALTDSTNPRDYWYRIKQREKISGVELSTICRQLKLEAPDGKLRATRTRRAMARTATRRRRVAQWQGARGLIWKRSLARELPVATTTNNCLKPWRANASKKERSRATKYVEFQPLA